MSLRTMINAVRKKTESVSLKESPYAKPTGYIDTGCYALNRIVSGDVFLGIPEGRITTFYGESGCVPESGLVKVLVKYSDKVKNHLITSICDSNADILLSKTNLECLLNIGYSQKELSREMGLSRLSIRRIITGQTQKVNKGTVNKINDMLRRNTYLCKISDVEKIRNVTKDFYIKTPDGYAKTTQTFKKGLKHCLKITIGVNFETIVSDDHAFIGNNNEWIFAVNVIAGTELLTEDGFVKVASVTEVGMLECFDIDIEHPEHRYYIDGFAAHNSGKSRVVAQIIINALTKNNYDIIFYCDSEGGGLYDLITNSGVDTGKIEHVLLPNIEEALVKMLNIYASIKEEIKECKEKGTPAPKCLMVLDSFGMLVSNKTYDDAVEKGKQVSDMGLKAKLKNDFIKSMMIPSIMTNTALIVINHIYDNPGAMFSTKIKDQPGGKGLQFASHIIVQTAKSLAKDKIDGLDEGQSYFKGNEITYFTAKNRLVKLGYEAKMMVDLNTGTNKWDGLLDEARRLGYIQGGASGRYLVPTYSEKSLTMKELMATDDAWMSFLTAFNERSKKDMQYGTEMEAVLANKPLEDEALIEEIDADGLLTDVVTVVEPEVPIKIKTSKKA